MITWKAAPGQPRDLGEVVGKNQSAGVCEHLLAPFGKVLQKKEALSKELAMEAERKEI